MEVAYVRHVQDVLSHAVQVQAGWVDSRSTRPVSRSSAKVLGRMRTPMRSETTASARVEPVVAITMAATMTAIEPRASLSTSRNAARRFRFDDRLVASSVIDTALPTRPTTPKTSMPVEAISGGSNSRRMPSMST